MNPNSELDSLMRAAEIRDASDLLASQPSDLKERIHNLWDAGLPSGEKTGWSSVDQLYTVLPGQMTIVTGWPGSGKSEWLDALLLNISKRGWRLALYSPENQPVEVHVAKYIEKFLGKPFGHGPTERATKDETNEAIDELSKSFSFLVPRARTERQVFGVDDVLNAAELAWRIRGEWVGSEYKRGLVIDPWNEMEHLRPKELSETEYISQTLSRIRGWARAANTHVWIVAHPQKLRREEGGGLPIPRPDSISGSQHWWNKADNCITVHRNQADRSQEVEIHIQKIRFKHIGRVGMTSLNYDRVTGRYHEQPVKLAAVGYDHKSRASGEAPI